MVVVVAMVMMAMVVMPKMKLHTVQWKATLSQNFMQNEKYGDADVVSYENCQLANDLGMMI